nr:PREDICTED: uncharacterized protein LOC105676660 [Linepithema humile]
MVERKQKSAFVVDVAEQNKSHASDFYYAVQISVRLLKPIGAWPLANDETSRFKIITHKVSMIIALFLFTFTIAPWIADTMKEKWSVFLILRLCPLFFTMTVFARYILLVWHQEQLRSCIDHVADDWQCVIIPKDREIMLENARMGRTFGTFSVAFMFSCGALYYTLPIVSLNTIDEDNMTVRLHPSPCELIVCDCQASPVYEIAYFLQFLCGYTAYSTFCGICSLIANFVMHVCGQCDVLVSIFEETVDGGEHNNGPIDSRIATADLNNNESFVQIFMYVFGLVSIIFNIFMFCYIGDLLKECCQNVGTACYAMEWYRMPPKKAIELIMPIAMSRYPATLTAGKLLSMTLATFSDADVKYAVQQNYVVLCMLGIWPSIDRRPNTIEKIVNITVMISCYFFLQCDIVPGVLYYVFVDNETREKIKMVPPVLYSIMMIAKYSNLISHECDIRSCLRHIKEDWEIIITDGAREMMLDKANTARRLFILCCTFMYGGGLCYNMIMPLSQGSIVTDQNITIRPLSCPGYYVFFNPQNSPAYEIVFLLQALCGFVMYTITVTTCSLAALFVMHACAQMQILMRLMEIFVEESELDKKNTTAKLAIIVEHQIRIRNFLQLVENTLRYSNLVEIAEEICWTSCTLDWYRLPINTARDMILVIVASNVSPRLTAGKFMELSFRTFGDVIKSAVIYLNILRQLTE